jgi:hypothetical protein
VSEGLWITGQLAAAAGAGVAEDFASVLLFDVDELSLDELDELDALDELDESAVAFVSLLEEPFEAALLSVR